MVGEGGWHQFWPPAEIRQGRVTEGFSRKPCGWSAVGCSPVAQLSWLLVSSGSSAPPWRDSSPHQHRDGGPAEAPPRAETTHTLLVSAERSWFAS